MIAEYLDLIVGVTDNFSDDLMDLVGTLEYIDTLESRISPLRIRVNVHDQGLDNLEKKLTRIQALEATNIAAGTPTGLADTVTQSPSPPSPNGSSGGGARKVAETSGGFLRIEDDEMRRMSNIFGESQTRRTLMNHNFTFLDAISDTDTPMFGVTQSDVKRNLNISGERLARATDWDSLLSDVGSAMGEGGPASMADLTKIDSLDTLNLDRADYIDMGKIKRMRWMDALSDIRVGMTQFYDLLAAVMPLLGTFVGAMPAAIAALGGLGAAALGAAAGLAGIAGLGFMGAAMSNADGMPGMEDFREVLEDLPDDFYEAFSGLAQQLEPTFDQGLEGLQRFFNELSQRGDALTALSDDARDFGSWLIDFTADGLQMLALLGDRARPVFNLLAEGLEDRDILAGLAASLQMTLPYLVELGGTISDVLPGIVKFSTGMMTWANTVFTALTYLGGFLSTVAHLATFMQMDGNKALGIFLGTLFTLTSVMLIASKTAGLYAGAMEFLTTSQLLANSSIYQGILAHTSHAASMIQAQLAAMGLTVSVNALTWAIRGLLAVTGIGLAVAGIGYVFEKTSAKIDEATASLGEFQNQYNQLDGGGAVAGMQGASGSNVYVNYTDNSQTSIQAPDRSTGEELSQYGQYQDWASNESDFSTIN